MPRQAALFPAPERAAPRRLMHVCDAGNGEEGTLVQFHCARCDHRSEWLRGITVSEAKRGLPCPRCNTPATGEVTPNVSPHDASRGEGRV
jgi:hypothetical protein